MRRSLLLATLALLFSTAAYAQPFERRISGPVNERPNCVEHTTTGGYIIAGTEKLISDV
ncbi:MAG: hypothetical protein AAF581_02290 [Planctomycetota bacterium]